MASSPCVAAVLALAGLLVVMARGGVNRGESNLAANRAAGVSARWTSRRRVPPGTTERRPIPALDCRLLGVLRRLRSDGDVRLPTWIRNPQRARPSLFRGTHELGALSASDVGAAAVQAAHARRVRAHVARFLDWAADQAPNRLRPARAPTLSVEWVHREVQRPSVSAFVTAARQRFFALDHVLPAISRSAEVKHYLAGLGVMTARGPTAPEAPRVPATQAVRAAVRSVCKLAATCTELEPVLAVMVVQLAGLRLLESVRTVAFGRLRAEQTEDRYTLWILPFGVKADQAAATVRDRERPVVVPRVVARLVSRAWGRVQIPAKLREVLETTRVCWRAVGVTDVRQIRRAVAAWTWSALSSETEAAALRLVRHRLGHAPDSTSTVRYLPSRMTGASRRQAQARATVTRI